VAVGPGPGAGVPAERLGHAGLGQGRFELRAQSRQPPGVEPPVPCFPGEAVEIDREQRITGIPAVRQPLADQEAGQLGQRVVVPAVPVEDRRKVDEGILLRGTFAWPLRCP
jgi:hypothetical protein